VLGSDAVSNKLFELFHLGEAFLSGTRPNGVIVDSNFKDASRSGLKADLTYLILKCRQQLLRRPGSTKKPTALGAIFDLYPWSFIHLSKFT